MMISRDLQVAAYFLPEGMCIRQRFTLAPGTASPGAVTLNAREVSDLLPRGAVLGNE
jgi:hypothetical protein